jgi:hypothetical protein
LSKKKDTKNRREKSGAKPKNRNSLPDDLGRVRERRRIKEEERRKNA